jgi:hypothetical protein
LRQVPQKHVLQELTIAFAKGDTKFLLNSVTDDICWNVVGDQVIQGKEHFVEASDRRKQDPVVELSIHHVAMHGKTRAFCDVYSFSNSKGTSVSEITSYLIEIK